MFGVGAGLVDRELDVRDHHRHDGGIPHGEDSLAHRHDAVEASDLVGSQQHLLERDVEVAGRNHDVNEQQEDGDAGHLGREEGARRKAGAHRAQWSTVYSPSCGPLGQTA